MLSTTISLNTSILNFCLPLVFSGPDTLITRFSKPGKNLLLLIFNAQVVIPNDLRLQVLESWIFSKDLISLLLQSLHENLLRLHLFFEKLARLDLRIFLVQRIHFLLERFVCGTILFSRGLLFSNALGIGSLTLGNSVLQLFKLALFGS